MSCNAKESWPATICQLGVARRSEFWRDYQLTANVVSEAASVGVAGAIFATWVRGRLSWTMLQDSLQQTMSAYGLLLWLTFGATALIGIYNLHILLVSTIWPCCIILKRGRPARDQPAAFYRALWPLMLLQILAIVIVIAFPDIALWLPNSMNTY